MARSAKAAPAAESALVARRGAMDLVDVVGQHLRYVLALAGERRDRHVRIGLVHLRPLGEIIRRVRDRGLIEDRVLECREILILGGKLRPELDIGRKSTRL